MRPVLFWITAIATISGCSDSKDFDISDLVGSGVTVTPDEPLGGYSVWYFWLESESMAYGCNADYTLQITDWETNDSEDSLFFRYENDTWEKYYLTIDEGSKPATGTFDYEGSVSDIEMFGRWEETSTNNCL